MTKTLLKSFIFKPPLSLFTCAAIGESEKKRDRELTAMSNEWECFSSRVNYSLLFNT